MVDTARTSLTFEDGDKAVFLTRDVEKQSASISDDLVRLNYFHQSEAELFIESIFLTALYS
jgi:hypothetical protein